MANRFTSESDPEVTFLFSPQATHYAGMGKGLYDAFTSFAVVIDRAEAIYAELSGRSLKGDIWEEPATIHEPHVSGPGIFAVQVALVQLLRDLGVKASVVLGHSFGEYAAAVSAGVLSLEDGMRLVLQRALLVKAKVPEGYLTVLRATRETVEGLISSYEKLNGPGSGPEIAALNGPEIVAVGGSTKLIASFEEHCTSAGAQFLRLEAPVPYAYHTSHMDTILEGIGEVGATLTHAPPKVTFISCTTGSEHLDFGPEYWKALTRNPIQFAKALQTLDVDGRRKILIEIGPTPKLINLVKRNFPQNPPKTLHVMTETEGNLETLLNCLSTLSLEGLKVNWDPWMRKNPFDADNFSVRPTEPGKLTRETNSVLEETLNDNEAEVDVTFCSLNYKDKGILDQGTGGKLGFDFSGTVRRTGAGVGTFDVGSVVYGMTLDGGALGSRLKVPQDTIAKLPSSLSLSEAAGMPLSYTIAWHTLVGLGGIAKGGGIRPHERILVNLSRGWIGIPLIQIAHSLGCEVFALSGSHERMTYLRSSGVKHIYDLENTMDFAGDIMRDTDGKGLTLVVDNFEAETLKKASLGLVADGGRFVDIAPGGTWTADYVNSLRPDVTYSLLNFSDEAKGQMTSYWQHLVPKFESGAFKSIPAKCFSVDDVKNVFDWFAEGKLGMSKPLIQISAQGEPTFSK